MTYRYSAENKQCYLSSDFGRDYACKVFGLTVEELETLVGRYVRGKRKGELRGAIAWRKIIRGGWVKTGAYDFDTNTPCGFVAKPGLTYGHALFDGNGKRLKGPDERADDAALIVAEQRRRNPSQPAPQPAVAPSPVYGSDQPWTAPYLFIGYEANCSLVYEAVRHGGDATNRASMFLATA